MALERAAQARERGALMGGSPFFARIKAHTLELVAAIPAGRVATYGAIAQWLDVPPRHVAYVLATLTPAEQSELPWFRAVASTGVVDPARMDALGVSQQALLANDGLSLRDDGLIEDFAARVIAIDAMPVRLPPQRRPADAPLPASRKRRRAR